MDVPRSGCSRSPAHETPHPDGPVSAAVFLVVAEVKWEPPTQLRPAGRDVGGVHAGPSPGALHGASSESTPTGSPSEASTSHQIHVTQVDGRQAQRQEVTRPRSPAPLPADYISQLSLVSDPRVPLMPPSGSYMLYLHPLHLPPGHSSARWALL